MCMTYLTLVNKKNFICHSYQPNDGITCTKYCPDSSDGCSMKDVSRISESQSSDVALILRTCPGKTAVCQCLRTDRPVRTASSEQVRQPGVYQVQFILAQLRISPRRKLIRKSRSLYTRYEKIRGSITSLNRRAKKPQGRGFALRTSIERFNCQKKLLFHSCSSCEE